MGWENASTYASAALSLRSMYSYLYRQPDVCRTSNGTVWASTTICCATALDDSRITQIMLWKNDSLWVHLDPAAHSRHHLWPYHIRLPSLIYRTRYTLRPSPISHFRPLHHIRIIALRYRRHRPQVPLDPCGDPIWYSERPPAEGRFVIFVCIRFWSIKKGDEESVVSVGEVGVVWYGYKDE